MLKMTHKHRNLNVSITVKCRTYFHVKNANNIKYNIKIFNIFLYKLVCVFA